MSKNDIAIIGIACRFPGSKNPDEYWTNLIRNNEEVKILDDGELLKSGESNALIEKPNYVRSCSYMDDEMCFDNSFFNYSPGEAMLIDPQQRNFLECCYEALDDAGYSKNRPEEQIGVFGSSSLSTYLLNLYKNSAKEFDMSDLLMVLQGNDKDYLATRVGYKLNLKGTALSVQCACSSSLAAVHLACDSLKNYENDLCLAGGVSLRYPQKVGYLYESGNIFSEKGHCRPFDTNSDGTVFGNGVGVVLLKRLSEAIDNHDNIYAVIKGGFIGNDGGNKSGFTVPSADGQAYVAANGIATADISSENIDFVEMHGTGTRIGEAIEIAGLNKAFRHFSDKKNYCYIGSVKSNIGHLGPASGVAGLIKVALALKNRMLPASINIKEPNKKNHLDDSPFVLATENVSFADRKGRLTGAVNSLGLGGTNVFVVLEEYKKSETKTEITNSRHYMAVFSHKSAKNLDESIIKIADDIANKKYSEKDVEYTLMRRNALPFRKCIRYDKCGDITSGLDALLSSKAQNSSAFAKKKIAFLYPGQGSQYYKMGLELYEDYPEFRKTMDDCNDYICCKKGINMLDVLYKDRGDLLEKAWVTQLAIFMVQYSSTKLLMEKGIKPDCLLGQSLGEYTAAAVSGVLSMIQAVDLLVDRGNLLEKIMPSAMVTVCLSPYDVKRYLNESLSISLVNSSDVTVISGTVEGIGKLCTALNKDGVYYRMIKTAFGYHSRFVDNILNDYKEVLSTYEMHAPQVPMISGMDGKILDAERLNSDYWISQMRNPVRLDVAFETLFDDDYILVDMGPGIVMSTLAKRHKAYTGGECLELSRHIHDKTDDSAKFEDMLGRFWSMGIDVKFDEDGYVVPLPPIVFEKRTFDFKSENNDIQENCYSYTSGVKMVLPRNALEKQVADIWSDVLGIRPLSVKDNFFDIGGHSLMAVKVISRLKEIYPVDIPVSKVFENPTIETLSSTIENELVKLVKNMPDDNYSRFTFD